jgi:ABC-type Fe3+-siderophore transport system permease subunit
LAGEGRAALTLRLRDGLSQSIGAKESFEKVILHHARPATVAAMTLVVALAVAGCGQHKATQAPSNTPEPTSSAASASASASTVESGGASPSGSSSTASPGSASSSATAHASVPATPDAVASELDQIDQLINDINNSVSGSDSSQQGGE